MQSAQARVPTDRASRYIAQLCRHFAHKVHAEWTDTRGFADFAWGTCTLIAEPAAIHVVVESTDSEGLGRVKHVVQDHLERFGSRDRLKVDWTPISIDSH